MQRMRIILIMLLVLFRSDLAIAYDDKVTHRDITLEAVKNSVLKSYLSSNLGQDFSNNYETIINSKTVIDWIKQGSIDEDTPMCRASNHFHNPLLPWSQSYMSDDTTTVASLIRSYCNMDGWPYSDRKSLVTWGTGYLSPGGSKISINNQENGWDNARNYYLTALTTSSSTDRETNFAKTFQALGQVLHLIEDGAQPAHVRNDFQSHITFTGVESFNLIKWFGSQYEHYVANHQSLVTSSSSAPPTFQNPRVTDFFDTDQYNGQDPYGITGQLGIVEFTNSHYFSTETIPNNSPSSEHAFPYPQVNSANSFICVDYAEGSTDLRKYVSRNGRNCPIPSDSRAADHFAAASLVNDEDVITDDNIQNLKLTLDENVYGTYAKELIPKAIGYSAALLNYFFRGDIDMVSDSDPKNPGNYMIVNNYNEAMKGTFSLYYEDRDGNRKEVATNWGELSIPAGKSKEDPGKSSSLAFTEPDDIKEQGKYILVFNGTLGNENGAVSGKAVTLEGKWEDWNTGKYTATEHYAYDWDYNYTNVVELYNIQTDKHLWGGVWVNQESPDPAIKVEDGKLTLDIYNGNYPLPSIPAYYKSSSRGRMWADDAPASASLAGCQMKMNIPRATVDASHSYNKFRITLRISNGSKTSEINFGLRNVSHVSDWDNDTIWINQGEVTQNLEDAFNHVNSIWHNLGDVNNWRIKEVGMFYELGGKDNHMGVDIDYIDFKCEKN